MSEAEKNLRCCQKQLDMDGCFVGVSRQALDETLDELAALRARVAELEGALRRYGKHQNCCVSISELCPCDCGFDAAIAGKPQEGG